LAPGDLLVLRVERDRCGPVSGGRLGPVGGGELVELAVGGRRVEVLAVGIDERRRLRDQRRVVPRRDPLRYEPPQHGARVGVDGIRPAVVRRHEEGVVAGAFDEGAVDIGRRGVGRPLERDLQTGHRADVAV
jgi:hypothetical protein